MYADAQDHGWTSEQGANTSSEDCLYLNVYRPTNGSRWGSDDPLPVMVYFPAGEFLIGSSNDLENNWAFSPSVVLVTINYRLGWLGKFQPYTMLMTAALFHSADVLRSSHTSLILWGLPVFPYSSSGVGFAALDELRHLSPVNSTGNLGMQDQRAALRWLGRNVAAFGGDPARMYAPCPPLPMLLLPPIRSSGACIAALIE
jgi:para-nitrobenzyl esterase